jgi:ABC-type taurine transport system substrate-binding protein
MAYAWNPTVQGAKSEGTVLVDDGFEPLTLGEGPTLSAEAVGYDATLERPAPLEPR